MAAFFDSISVQEGVYKYYCNGKWQVSASGALVPIKNPETDEVAFRVQACSRDEVDEAVAGASKAQDEWVRTPLWRRAEGLKAAARHLREHADPLAKVLMTEVAKPARASVSEVVRSADLIDYCAEEGVRALSEGRLLTSDAFPGNDRTKLCLVSRVALGVVLCIPPFNYPVNLAVSKIAPALMAGNAVVMKPPTQGAASGVHLVQAFHAAGLPAGLLQCITGRGSEIGDYMTTHPGIDCISFTGGDTGLSISRKAGMVPLQMELGGKDVCIVCADADLDRAAKAIVTGGLSYQGQRCTAVKIVCVIESVADALVAKVRERVVALKVGSAADNADICAVISSSSADWAESLVTDARDKGAEMVTEWRREGNLLWPTVVDHVTPGMQLAWEEQFAPIIPFMRVASADEAVAHCNSSRLALQGCVFTQDVNEAMRISDAMKTGTVQVNGPPARGPDHFPFQGFRDSGIGSQGIQNSLAMMTKVKSTVLNMPVPSYTRG